MATLKQNIDQTIADFDDIKAALEESGVAVPWDTDTSTYGNKIRGLSSGTNLDYEKLQNKPQIGGQTLIGNKSLHELGLDSLSNLEIEDLLKLSV